jgi:hypothetical protein
MMSIRRTEKCTSMYAVFSIAAGIKKILKKYDNEAETDRNVIIPRS